MADQPERADSPIGPAERTRLGGVTGIVELKCVVDVNRDEALAALGMDPGDAEMCQQVFFDTPDLDLSDHGVTLRVRRLHGRSAESVIAVRRIDPNGVPPGVRSSRGFLLEVDAGRAELVCAAAVRAKLDPLRVKETLAGRWPLDKLFSDQQRELFEAYAPKRMPLAGLEQLGPIHGVRLMRTPSPAGQRLVAVLWCYPDATRILELSTRCRLAEGAPVAGAIKAFLAERDIAPSEVHDTKTRTAMHSFASALHAATRRRPTTSVSR